LKNVQLTLIKQIISNLYGPSKRNKVRILWIGDSHSAFLRRGVKEAKLDLSSIVYWLGPRLMYSISKHDFPLPFGTRRIMRLWRPTAVVVVLGEIDVRMFLAADEVKNRDNSWVREFLCRLDSLRRELGQERIFLLSSIPPSDLPPVDPGIERKGTLAERVIATAWLQNALELNLKQLSLKVSVLDLGGEISASDGSISQKYCSDGIHVNKFGASKIWEVIGPHILN